MSKTLKKFVYKIYFDKNTGMPIAWNTKAVCSNCPLFKKEGGNFIGYPPNMSGLYVVDLDQKLQPLIPHPPHIIEAEAEVLIRAISK